MADTTEEEVRRCPRCKQPGVAKASRPLKNKPGARLQNYGCENKRCRWYNTEWTVQINADGTIPPAVANRKKQFGRIDQALSAQVNANVENLLAMSKEQGQQAGRERN